MTPDPASSSSAPEASTADAVVSVIVGDRLCKQCGYNLTGQTILRERHYNLLIARCPECGSVASMHEYPVLGRWAGRWAALLAAFWFLILTILLIGSGAAIFGISTGIAYLSGESFGDYLRMKHEAWEAELLANPLPAATGIPPAPGTASSASGNQASITVRTNARGTRVVIGGDFTAFWKAVDHGALLDGAGGWFAAVDLRPLALLGIPLSLVSFLFGCIFAAALLGRRVRGRLAFGSLVMLVALAFTSLLLVPIFTSDNIWRDDASMRLVGWRTMLLALAWAWIVLSLGLIYGRSIMRGLLTLMLPPRLRSSLATLWIADGLAPPRARP